MRQPLLAFAILAAGLAPAAARAQIAQDRYGAPASDTSSTLRGAEQAQATLSWPGKAEPLRGPEGDAEPLRGSAPLDTATGRAVRQANSGRRALVSAPARTQAPSQPRSQIPSQAQPQARTLPTSLYDRGHAEAAPAARPTRPVQQGRVLAAAAPPSTAQYQGQPPLQGQTPAQTQAQQAPIQQTSVQQPPIQQAEAGETKPRFYSLHREYGLTPDPVPPAEPSVLELGPTVAQAMADDKDSPTIDLAGQDQADADAPPRNRNNTTNNGSSNSNSSTTTNANGQATTTYTIRQ